MLATPSPTGSVPRGDEWVHEVKWDGIRLMADVRDGTLRLLNRRGVDVTVAWPELAAVAGVPDDVLLDGEVVAIGPDGSSDLKAIAPRIHLRDPRRIAEMAAARPAQFMVFDVLRLAGRDLTGLALSERRRLLDALDLPAVATTWQVPPQYDDGELLAQVTLEAGLEGVVSKRRNSRYQPGVRGPDWLKVPHRSEFVGVIGGWLPETENRDALGSVWVGHPHDEATFHQTGQLYPITRAGSGLGAAVRADLLTVLRSLEVDQCPFVPAPVSPGTRWVEPLLCVQVRYLGAPGAFSADAPLTRQADGDAGQLRQPVLRCLRPDVTPVEAPTAALVPDALDATGRAQRA